MLHAHSERQDFEKVTPAHLAPRPTCYDSRTRIYAQCRYAGVQNRGCPFIFSFLNETAHTLDSTIRVAPCGFTKLARMFSSCCANIKLVSSFSVIHVVRLCSKGYAHRRPRCSVSAYRNRETRFNDTYICTFRGRVSSYKICTVWRLAY